MRAILCALALLFQQATGPSKLVGPSQLVGASAGGCTTPTGTNFTESFGDSSTLCWTSGPSTCNHTWTIGAGTAQSIISSPGSPPSNTACSNSVELNQPASAAYISANFTGISGAFDVTGTFYVKTFPGSFATRPIICVIPSGGLCAGGNRVMALLLDTASSCAGNAVFGSGSTNSTCTLISVNTWHTFTLHHDTTAANCSVAIDGGSAATFTCNTGTAATIQVGDDQSTSPAQDFVVGNVAF